MTRFDRRQDRQPGDRVSLPVRMAPPGHTPDQRHVTEMHPLGRMHFVVGDQQQFLGTCPFDPFDPRLAAGDQGVDG
jgi:hypothetical protein